MALPVVLTLDARDPGLFSAAVAILKDLRPRLLSANFAVAIAALAHREAAGRRWAISTPIGPGLTTGDFQRMCDDTWAKQPEFWAAHATGPIYKPFTDSFKSATGNNWRNSFDLQSGIGCDAPYAAEYLLSEAYVTEKRFDCIFRDPETATCLSPAGNVGPDRTCFDPSKNGNPPGPSSRALHRPKILTRGPTADGPLGYWLLEPTLESLAGLLADARDRVPAYPFAAALYGGSDYWLADGGPEITLERLRSDLGLSEDSFLALFDPSVSNPHNLRVVEFSADPAARDGLTSTGSVPGAATTSWGDAGLATPRTVTELDIDLDSIRVAAGATPDPEERARLMERANRGHQRALKQLIALLRSSDYVCHEQSGGFDLLAMHDVFGGHLFEVKTWTSFNLTKQVRGGWAQLWEYRYRNAHRWESPPALYLVFDREPPSDLWMWSWLSEFLGITPCWIDEDGRLATFSGFIGLLPPLT